MIIKSIVIARDFSTNEVIDIYEYERPLDKIGKECLSLWMNFTEIFNNKCSFEITNIKNDVGMFVCIENDDNDDNLFYRRVIIELKLMCGL